MFEKKLRTPVLFYGIEICPLNLGTFELLVNQIFSSRIIRISVNIKVI